jgi:hypothetical protein
VTGQVNAATSSIRLASQVYLDNELE